jgi:hypothetical protein
MKNHRPQSTENSTQTSGKIGESSGVWSRSSLIRAQNPEQPVMLPETRVSSGR